MKVLYTAYKDLVYEVRLVMLVYYVAVFWSLYYISPSLCYVDLLEPKCILFFRRLLNKNYLIPHKLLVMLLRFNRFVRELIEGEVNILRLLERLGI